jgi:PAS domain S-box-containing protein
MATPLRRPQGPPRRLRLPGTQPEQGRVGAAPSQHPEAEERALLAAIIQSSDDAIISKSLDGIITSWNPAAERMFGYTAEEAVNQPLQMLVPPERGAEEPEILRRILLGERIRQFETERLHKDGTRVEVSVSISPVRDGQGNLVGAAKVLRDISERRRAEEAERSAAELTHQVQKLESLSSLAGGVAHDMNNVLAAIQAVTETLQHTFAGDPRLGKSLEIIAKAALRGRDLVRGLTSLARKQLKEPEPLDLNQLVREGLERLRRGATRVALLAELAEPAPRLLGERATLAGVLDQLCGNALDAMPGGGTLTLRTRHLNGGQVELQVQDDGAGMPPEVARRAMEPFFTTKPMGKGSGLGLSLVYAAAKAHGGRAYLWSRPGQGTLVTLRLPLLEEK